MDLVVILSALKDVARVREFYTKAVSVAKEYKRILETPVSEVSKTEDTSGHLPTLL